MRTTKRSLIKKYFCTDLLIELMKVTYMNTINNNQKSIIIKENLDKYNVPYEALGTGTNRMAILVDGYAIKVALDSDGRIDNQREMKYSKALQPYVVKVYEALPNGLLAVSEYVTIFDRADFLDRQDEMTEILKDVSNEFLIGDVGITSKNYVNWGIRSDGSICMLDFAYIYSVQYKLFTCTCKDESMLQYDSDFVLLRCPSCMKKYTFAEIRKKVTKDKQKQEIGDLTTVGYLLSQPVQEVELIEEFEPERSEDKKKKKKKKILTPEEIELYRSILPNGDEKMDKYIESNEYQEYLREIGKTLEEELDLQDWDYPDQSMI